MNQEEKDEKEYNFQKLTPIDNAELKIYESALDFVFNDDDIKNVAISGPYSAGKSSIIESYKSNSCKRFLHISLAHFSEPTLDGLSDEKRESSKTRSEDSKTQSEDPKKRSDAPQSDKAILEGKILNQLIHQIKQKNIPQTRFKVKQKTEKNKIRLSAIISTIFLVMIYYIFSFNKWSSFVSAIEVNWLKRLLMWTTSDIALLISGLICLVIIGLVIHSIIKLQKNNNLLKRLKLQGNEIEIFEEKDDSFFDKYLNEVLYLFEQSEADAIIFEDMDRFNANKIFEKLREINTLVNNKRAEDKNQPIRFLYLLRDDIFSSKDRTKFFDFILPIVPVIDGSNSYDQLIEHLKEGKIFGLFDENFLNELSLYIDDMRILKNIYNEFIIYYDRILSNDDEPQTEQGNNSTLINLDNNKLLGIIAYKNIFPKDFSDLHLRTGFVYTLFENKPSFVEQEIERIDHEIGEIKEKIQSSEDEMFDSIDELDAVYLLMNHEIVAVAELNMSKFKTRVQLVKNMKENPDNIRRYGGVSFDIMTELEELKENPEYNKRKEDIERKNHDRIEKLKTKLQELKKKRNAVQNKKLKYFISKENIDTIFGVIHTNEIGKQNKFYEIKGSNYFPLIKYLIRYGYIDENYSDYMTYFYENSLSRIDKNFLLSVTDQIPKDYSYTLNNPDKVLSRLKPGHFDQVEILNFDLLNHLLLTKVNNASYLSNFLQQLKDTKNFQFIGGFLETSEEKETELFIKEINNTWSYIFQSIVDESDFSHEQKKQYAVYTLYYSPESTIENLNKSNCLTDFISYSHDFLDMESPDIENLIAGFSLLGVKFEGINYAEANTSLFQQVYQNSFYKLTFDLICLMLERVYGLIQSDDFRNKNYTLVISNQDAPLAQYVNSNFNHYIKEVLENCDNRITDEEPVALSIINHSGVDTENKNTYIGYLETIIKQIDSVKDKDSWSLLLQEQVVEYSERNILEYFFQHELDSYLIDFINGSDHPLEFKSNSIDSIFGKDSADKFFEALVTNNKLTNQRYESILKAFDMCFHEFPNVVLNKDKMQILIKIHTMSMTEKNLIFMRNNYSDLLLFFIKHNIRQYTEEVINEDNFKMDELLSILDENVEDSYKTSLLEHTSDAITLKENDYSIPVKLHILDQNLNEEEIPFLLDSYTNESSETMGAIKTIAIQHMKEIISKGYPVPFELRTELFLDDRLELKVKQELFVQYLPNMSNKQVIEHLKILQMGDFLSLFERKKPTFEKNDINKGILDDFEERKWITRFSIDENNPELYRANGRDIPELLEM